MFNLHEKLAAGACTYIVATFFYLPDSIHFTASRVGFKMLKSEPGQCTPTPNCLGRRRECISGAYANATLLSRFKGTFISSGVNFVKKPLPSRVGCGHVIGPKMSNWVLMSSRYSRYCISITSESNVLVSR